MLAESRARDRERLRATGAVTVAELEGLYGVSPMTARRDLAELERRGVVRRRTAARCCRPFPRTKTHSLAGSTWRGGQDRLAEAAVDLLTPRETIFLDSSTTTYYVARRLVRRGLAATVLTNSLPVLELLFRRARPRST